MPDSASMETGTTFVVDCDSPSWVVAGLAELAARASGSRGSPPPSYSPASNVPSPGDHACWDCICYQGELATERRRVSQVTAMAVSVAPIRPSS